MLKQQTMTKEQILEKNNNVKIFDHFYDGKQNITVERALKAMEEYAKQEVAKATERAEYAEKVAYETSKKNADLIAELSKEREKAKKLVEALEEIADMTGNILIYKKAKQSLTEYEK